MKTEITANLTFILHLKYALWFDHEKKIQYLIYNSLTKFRVHSVAQQKVERTESVSVSPGSVAVSSSIVVFVFKLKH